MTAEPAPPVLKPARDFSLYVEPEADGGGRLDLAVDGIQCLACIHRIEEAARATPGVIDARVNFTTRRLGLALASASVDPGPLMARLGKLGYRVFPFRQAEAEARDAEEQAFLLRCLAVAGFAMMNIMLLSVSVWSGNVSDITDETRDFFHWLSALIAVPAVAYAGQPFFRSALSALKGRALNMDVPISLGVLLATGLSLALLASRAHHAYFDSAVMLLFFLLIGRVLDRIMRRRMRAVAGNLAALKGDHAVKFVSPTEIVEVPLSAVKAGDLVLVRPGEKVSIDGVVEIGRSEIDLSLVTGETAPQAAEPGDAVYAGTLNLSGTLRIRVRAAESGTLIDEINRLLDGALKGRSAYVDLAARAARAYAPVVHVTALATFLGWIAWGLPWSEALVIAITVLIITCPCALALAIPAVQVVAAGALFKARVLLNGGDAIERLAAVDTIVFDKTGTLTAPEPAVTNLGAVPPALLAAAGALALASRHPLAKALAEAAGALAPPPDAVEEPGRGVRATLDGVEIRLGSAAFCDAEDAVGAARAADPDASVIAFRHGDATCAFAIRQTLREDAAEVVARLAGQGYRILVLSGDRPEAVARAAAALRIVEAEGGLSPAGKIARIEALRATGRRVLMVGDGVNDAPALAAADVSLSPSSAAGIAQAAADAVYLGDRLAPVADALAIARRAHALMRQNLWISVVYNFVAVPVAILGHVTPLIAALAMSGSSLIVSLNALRARRG